MQPSSPPYKPGQWVLRGTVLGAFIGILSDRFALGLIFGFFIGVAIDADRRKRAARGDDHPPDAGSGT